MSRRWVWGVKDGTTRLYDERGAVVATAGYKRGVVVEGKENARLIAAAPEMLALPRRMATSVQRRWPLNQHAYEIVAIVARIDGAKEGGE